MLEYINYYLFSKDETQALEDQADGECENSEKLDVRFFLGSLQSELVLHIVSYTDYVSALNLKLSSKHFNSIIDLKKMVLFPFIKISTDVNGKYELRFLKKNDYALKWNIDPPPSSSICTYLLDFFRLPKDIIDLHDFCYWHNY